MCAGPRLRRGAGWRRPDLPQSPVREAGLVRSGGGCIAGDDELGHQLVLEQLGLRPLPDLDLRLGEGGGALLALPIVEASVGSSTGWRPSPRLGCPTAKH